MNKQSGKIKKIAFVVAMLDEAKVLIDHFGLKKADNIFDGFLPMVAYHNSFYGSEIFLVVNGKDKKYQIDNIGTQAAALTSYLVISHFKPDVVINAGTAGGIKSRELSIGDVFIAQGKTIFHDRRIPLPKFREYGLGSYEMMDCSAMIDELKLKPGVVSTGNAFDMIEEDRQLMEAAGATLKDMEAASIAWVAQLSGTPLIIVKAVTDYIGVAKSSEYEFANNFNKSVAALGKACHNIVQYLNKKGL